ncbi:HNH endonuclease [Nocardioides alcanivorans]|uniref:HNH endonuclease n=1 Tax=Nocardioides alcanivorans TaxID=2897352 RepID=UPI001F2B811C|nr:HNH endonuclease [Nocardioides alcanivorans]
MTAATVRLLNASYEPMGRVSFQQAMKMLWRRVAIVEEALDGRSVGPHPWPTVIRLVRYVAQKWLYRPAGWHRGGVFLRDGHRCAYCGRKATTLDHVVPRSRGGGWTWTNVVSACWECNGRKADRTPEEAGMPLRHATPYVPLVVELVRARAVA